MPLFKLTVGSEVRTFAFYAPRAWQQYVGQLNRGLPLVIALHDRETAPWRFREIWPFHDVALAASTAMAPVALEDRFFVLYPHASGVGVLGDPGDGTESDAVWAYGYDSRGYTDAVDDVAAIDAMVAMVEARLDQALADDGVTLSAVDADRIYLFGRAEGGQMVHRLIKESPGRYAAIYTLSASHSGLPHGMLPIFNQVVNGPEPGSPAVHAFIHVGALDRYVAPGPGGLTPSGVDTDRLQDEGLDPVMATSLGRHDAAQRTTTDLYAAHGGCTLHIGPGGALPSMTGALVSTIDLFLNPAALPIPPLTPPVTGGPAAARVYANVVQYVDPTLDESSPDTWQNRYATAATVWASAFAGRTRPT